MRTDDILFRGYNKQTRKWYYGDFVKDFDWNGNRQYLICSIPESPDDEVIFMDVDPETVGQWTGLVDISGNKLFTDDLVECYWIKPFKIDTVLDFNKLARVIDSSGLDDGLCGYWRPQDTQVYKLVGNIYDNPDIYEQMKEHAWREYRERMKREYERLINEHPAR